MLLKGAKLSDYNGRTMSVLSSTTMQMNPDIPEAHSLRGWYDQGGCDSNIQDLSTGNQGGMGGLGGGGSGSVTQSNWKCLEQVREEQLGMNDKPDYFTTSGTITYARKENSMYMACSTENCNKKVVDQNNGFYRCEKCGKDFDNFKWRMILSVGFKKLICFLKLIFFLLF
jgi:replication factor A1